MNNFNNYTSLVVENQLFPCVTLFKRLVKVLHLDLEQCETFQKMSFRNRFIVASANGLITLSVPLKNGREQKQIISKVEVDDLQNWKSQHLKTIVSCYKKAPFFEHYFPDVQKLISSNEPLLFNLDLAILEWVLKVLRIDVEVTFTKEFIKTYSDPLVIDFRNKILPKNFQSNEEESFKKYAQVFENKIGFQANLSILDLIFNEGPNAIEFLN